MDSVIDDIAKEVSVYFSVGTVARDLAKHDDYEIKDINKSGLVFEHKPNIRSEKKNDLPIGYDELDREFSKGRFAIQGFSTTIENGYKHDLEKLKRAIKDTRGRIESEERRIMSENLILDKATLEKEKLLAEQAKADAIKAQQLAEQETAKAKELAESLIEKRKSANRIKTIAEEERLRQEEEARVKAERLESERIEAERIANEAKVAHDYKIKNLIKKKNMQQQRLRLINKPI